MNGTKAKDKAKVSENRPTESYSSTQAKTKQLSKISKANKIISAISKGTTNPMSVGVNKLAKAVPIVGMIIALVEIGMNIADTSIGVWETATGYTALGWKNFKQISDWIFSPVSNALNMVKSEIERGHQVITYNENVKIRGGFMGDYNV